MSFQVPISVSPLFVAELVKSRVIRSGDPCYPSASESGKWFELDGTNDHKLDVYKTGYPFLMYEFRSRHGATDDQARALEQLIQEMGWRLPGDVPVTYMHPTLEGWRRPYEKVPESAIIIIVRDEVGGEHVRIASGGLQHDDLAWRLIDPIR